MTAMVALLSALLVLASGCGDSDDGPARPEPAYEQVPSVPEAARQPLPDDLPRTPSEAPRGPPPGPLSGAEGSASRSAYSANKYGETFLGCSPWGQYHLPGSSTWTYGCFWRLASPPGASPGIFNNVRRYEQYYFAGYDRYGNPVARLYASGTL